MRKVELLPTRDCVAGYGPAFNSNFKISWHCQYQKKKKECSDKITLKTYKQKEAAAAAQQHPSDHIN